jgi:uncharacterized protein GlcG (DUF336 family)
MDAGMHSLDLEQAQRIARALLGAVGISGDTADNEEACAVAAIEAAGLRADTGE